jgi:co-chaperonin GroES (HSP10)
MFRPILDRILLRAVTEEKRGLIEKPDAYQESNKYEVIALGDFVMFGGVRVPLFEIVEVGDTVLVGQYNLERIELEGQEFFLTRVQDIRGREAHAARARAAA